MTELAYVFERFPSFGQTFCYREIAELIRQGIEPQIFSIRRPLDEPQEAWDPRIVARVHYLPDEKPLVAEVEAAIRHRRLPPSAETGLREWGRRTDFLRLYQAVYIGSRLDRDIRRVHAHFAGMAARTAWWIRRFHEVAFSFTAHANDIFATRPFAISLEKLMTDAAAVVTVSDFSAALLRAKFPAAARRIHRVYNGISLAQFQRARCDAAPPRILSIGRLIEKKGFGDLIAACELLARRHRDFHCDIIGDGPLEPELRRAIEAAQLSDIVTLRGAQPQQAIAAALANATVFALPCTTEKDGGMDNLPTVIMEAMAAGLPVVSTHLAGVPEMVADNVTGLLVRPKEAAELAAAIEQLLWNRERARQFGDAGYALVREKFAIEQTTRELRALLLD